MTSENRIISDSSEVFFYSIIMFRSFILIISLPSRQPLLIGDGVTVDGFLSVGSHRITAREVIVVDNATTPGISKAIQR